MQKPSYESEIEQESATDVSPGPAAKQKPVKHPAPAASRQPPLVSKTMVNFLLDSLLLVLAVLLLFSAAVLRFVFPAPTASAGWTLWGYGYDAWANLQFVLVTVFGAAVVVHVMLHWSWVCAVAVNKLLRRTGPGTRPDDGQQTLWGVGMLIVVVNVLGILIGLAYLTIQGPPLP